MPDPLVRLDREELQGRMSIGVLTFDDPERLNAMTEAMGTLEFAEGTVDGSNLKWTMRGSLVAMYSQELGTAP